MRAFTKLNDVITDHLTTLANALLLLESAIGECEIILLFYTTKLTSNRFALFPAAWTYL